MTIFETKQAYAPSIEMKYDSQRQLYLGTLIASSGVYSIEGVDRADVSYSIDRLLHEEYQNMVRDVSKAQSYGRGRGGGGGGERSMGGEKVHTINASEARQRGKGSSGLSTASTWVDIVGGAMAIGSGNWLNLAYTAGSLAIGDMLEGAGNFFDRSSGQRLFAVTFGGVLITATSRKALRKKLTRQKNKRLHIIMNHVRKLGMIDGDPLSERSKLKRENNKIRQLRKKKEQAMILGPDRWKKTVSPQGQQTGWKSRTLDLRERIQSKKALSQELWVEKVGNMAQRYS